MENISNFLSAAQKFGLQSTDLFQTVDLYEGKNIPRVIMTLLTIARVVAGIPLNSHRKSIDFHKSFTGSWNTGTLITSQDTTKQQKRNTNFGSERNQPTLVNHCKFDSHSIKASNTRNEFGSSRNSTSAPSAVVIRKQYKDGMNNGQDGRERRRSSRRSASSLFISNAKSDHVDKGAPTTLEHNHCTTFSSESQDITLKMGLVFPGTECDQEQACEPSATNDANDDKKHTPLHTSIPESRKIDQTIPKQSPSVCNSTYSHDNISSCALTDDSERPSESCSKRYQGKREQHKECLTVYSESVQRITNYQLGNCIGRGQFGSVYRALDLETGQMVAVKQISLEGQNTDDLEDVMQEVELLKSLSSPRIVRYYGFVKTATHLNIVMEYVENGSLSATLKSFGSFPERLVLAYAVKIIEGLIYLHGREVVHCDLKACNILTTKKGNTKLTDFGVSLNLKLRNSNEESVIAGTPYWMAPEVIKLDGACTASDIWSLGCTIIELLTGKPPYSDMMQMAALYHIVEDDHPPIPEGITEELKDFLLRCFKKNPIERPTAHQLMSHKWTLQYRRNRKEMKMLRRTCSRRMSSYITNVAGEYPPFKPNTFEPIPPVPAAATAAAAAAAAGSEIDYDKLHPEHTVLLSSVPDTGLESIPQNKENGQTSGMEKCADKSGLSAPSPEHTSSADEAATDTGSIYSIPDDDNIAFTTFEGPKMKRHRLRTIICDTNSLCSVCSKSLNGVCIQCTSCKIRCHDACTKTLKPCTAMRMSRFLYPANRKSSKRYESKAANIKLRARRTSGGRISFRPSLPGKKHQDDKSDTLNSTVTHSESSITSSDSSLGLAAAILSASSSSLFKDGFDGSMSNQTIHKRPISIAGTDLNRSVAIAGSSLGRKLAAPLYPKSHLQSIGEATTIEKSSTHQSRTRAPENDWEIVDSGWETDDVTDFGSVGYSSSAEQSRDRNHQLPQPGPSALRNLLPKASRSALRSNLSGSGPSIIIPNRHSVAVTDTSFLHATHAPFSAPIATESPQVPLIQGRSYTEIPKPVRFCPLSNDGGSSVAGSISRGRSNTYTQEETSVSPTLDGYASNGSDVQRKLVRRHHPLRGATSSDFKAVAGFSPGAARRAKVFQHGSSASISDLQSYTSSEFIYSQNGLNSSMADLHCCPVPSRSSRKRLHIKRNNKDCIIM